MITAARNGDDADDENFKCYFKCLFDQMGCVSFSRFGSFLFSFPVVHFYNERNFKVEEVGSCVGCIFGD